MRISIVAMLATLLAAQPAAARPVSYPGGITLMQELNPNTGSALLHYTPTRHYSVGARYLRMRPDNNNMMGANVTWLAKRWNMPGAQANLYVTGFGGAGWHDSGPAKAAGFIETQADWENRRVMLMGMARLTHIADMGTTNMQMGRLGWAPYEGDYGDAHLWLFAQVKRESDARDEIQPALVGRLFYRTILLEAGVTDRGGLILNSVFRF